MLLKELLLVLLNIKLFVKVVKGLQSIIPWKLLCVELIIVSPSCWVRQSSICSWSIIELPLGSGPILSIGIWIVWLGIVFVGQVDITLSCSGSQSQNSIIVHELFILAALMRSWRMMCGCVVCVSRSIRYWLSIFWISLWVSLCVSLRVSLWGSRSIRSWCYICILSGCVVCIGLTSQRIRSWWSVVRITWSSQRISYWFRIVCVSLCGSWSICSWRHIGIKSGCVAWVSQSLRIHLRVGGARSGIGGWSGVIERVCTLCCCSFVLACHWIMTMKDLIKSFKHQSHWNKCIYQSSMNTNCVYLLNVWKYAKSFFQYQSCLSVIFITWWCDYQKNF
jgi:hypothetical protein